MSLRDRWGALSRAEQVALPLSVACALVAVVGLATPTVVRLRDPVEAVRLHVETHGYPGWCGTGATPYTYQDPWGRPWLSGGAAGRAYSGGPDGKDDALGGDDVPILLEGPRRPGLVRLIESAPAALVVAVALAWLVAVRRGLLRGARASALVEAGRALLAVSLPAVLLATWAADRRWSGGLSRLESATLLVSPPVAAALSLSFLAFLVKLAWRLRRTG